MHRGMRETWGWDRALRLDGCTYGTLLYGTNNLLSWHSVTAHNLDMCPFHEGLQPSDRLVVGLLGEGVVGDVSGKENWLLWGGAYISAYPVTDAGASGTLQVRS